jgi:MerR family transcriptional regulator, redox-sensitive transcriptional activator SoxR
MASKRESKNISITAAAGMFGLRTSAVRYYEQVGLLPPIARSNGQRVFDQGAVNRLAMIAGARRAGLSVAEIGRLISGFRSDATPGQRWQAVSDRKLAELERIKDEITQTQNFLRKLQACNCRSLESCGEKIRAGLAGKPIREQRIEWFGGKRRN